MTIERLTILPLRMDHAEELAPRIREADVVECLTFGRTAHEALDDGLDKGVAYGVWDGGTILGAYGYVAKTSSIWSLWAPLTLSQSREILRRTPAIVDLMRRGNGGPLMNFVWAGNGPALAWLKASGCFEFGPEEKINGRAFVPFQTREPQHV